MTLSSTVDALIHTIYQGTLEDQPWQSFASALREVCDCDIAGLSLQPARTDMRSVSIWITREPMESEALELAAARRMELGHLDPLARMLRHSGDLYTLSEIVDIEAFHASEYYQRFASPYRLEHQLGLCIVEAGGWSCQLGLMNGPDREDFGEWHRQLMRRLHPHLENALALFARIKSNELEKAIYRDVLDKLGIGAVILDGQARVMDCNDAARHILAANPCLTLRDRRISATGREQARRLRELITLGLQQDSSRSGAAFSEVIRLSHQGESMDVLVRSTPGSHWYRHPARPRLTLYLSGQTPVIPPAHTLARLLGLTPSEARLTVLLARGLSLAEAAVAMGITENSARTYSKKIYSKTGARRQAELVRIVLKSVALLDDSATECEH